MKQFFIFPIIYVNKYKVVVYYYIIIESNNILYNILLLCSISLESREEHSFVVLVVHHSVHRFGPADEASVGHARCDGGVEWNIAKVLRGKAMPYALLQRTES